MPTQNKPCRLSLIHIYKQDERTDAGDQVQQQEPGAHIDVVQPPCPEGEEREQNSQPINRLDHTEDGKNPGQDAQDVYKRQTLF